MRSLPSSFPTLGAIATLLGGLVASPAFAATEYHWVGAPTAEFGTPTNWNPVRTTPAADDRLVFEGGVTYTVMNPTTATIGQFVVENPTHLILAANTGLAVVRTIIIGGGAGTDLEIEPGASVTIVGDKAITFLVRSGATASIAGRYTIDSNPANHQLIGEAAEAIQFLAGSVFELREGTSANPFNNGNFAPDVPNMVRFRAASAYIHGCGQPPPITDVVFDPDSRYIHVDESPPTFVGRTYGDFDYNSPLLQTIAGSGDFALGDLIVTQGRLNLAVNGNGVVTGPVVVLPGAYLRLGATSGTLNLRLAGIGQQVVQNPNNGAGGAGLTTTTGLRLIIDNPSGVRLDNAVPLDFAGVLEFQRGIVTTSDPQGNNQVRLRYGTGSTTGASASTGWFHGYMLADITPGNPTVTFPFGTETTFNPYTLTVHGLSDTARVGGSFEDELPASWFDGVQLHPVKRLDGKDFYVTVQRDTNYSSFDATFNFQPPPGADPLQFVARVRASFNSPPWRPTTLGTRTATSLQVLGMTRRPGDRHFYFALGEPSQVLVSVSDGAVEEGGTALRTGAVSEGLLTTLAFRVSLSEPAVGTITVDYATAAGSAQSGTDFTPGSGTLTFLPGDTVKVVEIPILGEGDPENHETLALVLSNPSGGVIGDGTGEGTILDDDDVTPPTAAVVHPNGGETLIEGTTVDLQWTATDNVAVVALELAYSPDGGTTWLSIATDVPNTGSHSWPVPVGLTQNALFRIRAYDPHGRVAVDTSDAPWWIWNVDGVEPVVPGSFALSLASANPSPGGARLRLAKPREQAIRADVYDVAGRRVATLVDGVLPAGMHDLEWKAEGAAAGVYLVGLVTDGFRARERIVRLP